MFQFKIPKAFSAKINQKRVIQLLFLTIMFFFMSDGLALAGAKQSFQSEAAIDGYSGVGAGKGMGLWILFTLAISYGLNNYLRKRENKPEKNQS